MSNLFRVPLLVGMLASVLISWPQGVQTARGQDDKSASAPGKTVEVTAQFLIVPKRLQAAAFDKTEDRRPIDEDFMATQPVIIGSPPIISRAVTKYRLGDLKSIGSLDPIATIRKSLIVRRPLGKGNVFELTFRGSDASDGIAVLDAVTAAYQEYLTDAYINENERVLENLHRATEMIRQKQVHYKNDLLTFRRKPNPGNRSAEEIRAVQVATASKRAALVIARKEIEGRLAVLEKAAADPRTRILAQLKANEWAARTGFDKLPATVKQGQDVVEVFRESLKQDLEENQLVDKALGEVADSERNALADVEAHQATGENLREEVARTKKLLDEMSGRLAEVDLAQGLGGYDARLIAPPARKTAQ